MRFGSARSVARGGRAIRTRIVLSNLVVLVSIFLTSCQLELVRGRIPLRAKSETVFFALSDSFNDGQIDERRWNVSNPEGLEVGETSQGLRIVPLQGAPGDAFAEIALQGDFKTNLTNQSAAIRVVSPGESNVGIQAYFALSIDSSNRIRFVKEDMQLRFQVIQSGVITSSTTLAYVPGQHRWWRLRHDSGTGLIHWETSGNGSVWTVRRTLLAPFDLERATVVLGGGTYLPSILTGVIIFDDFITSVIAAQTIVPLAIEQEGD